MEISIDAEALKALLQKTEGITGDSLPEGTEAVDARTEELLQSFNVIVIQECTRVRYDENGNAYADWDAAAATEEGEGA